MRSPSKNSAASMNYLDALEDVETSYRRTMLASPDHSWPAEVREMLTILNAHIFDPSLTMADLADACRINDHNASCRFLNYLGVTPKTYRVSHQIELAKRLLHADELQEVLITQIAFQVGYERVQSFCTAFKRREGVSPKEYQLTKLRKM
jgi:AraC family transcriptional regulator